MSRQPINSSVERIGREGEGERGGEGESGSVCEKERRREGLREKERAKGVTGRGAVKLRKPQKEEVRLYPLEFFLSLVPLLETYFPTLKFTFGWSGSFLCCGGE